MTKLDIVYEDDALLVVDKPAGLLMHPSWLDKRETDTLASRIKAHFIENGLDSKVHTVHRLDRPTSGLVVIAKQDGIAKQLAEQFAGREVKKNYWAIARGFVPEVGEIDHPLKEEHDKIADKFADQNKEAQPATTQFKRLGICELAIPVSRYPKARLSWVECTPLTGRKHQIRRHFKHLRHPLLGDSRHGCRHLNQAFAQEVEPLSLALRAVRLEFKHPVTGQLVTFKAGKNEQWEKWLKHFGWS